MHQRGCLRTASISQLPITCTCDRQKKFSCQFGTSKCAVHQQPECMTCYMQSQDAMLSRRIGVCWTWHGRTPTLHILPRCLAIQAAARCGKSWQLTHLIRSGTLQCIGCPGAPANVHCSNSTCTPPAAGELPALPLGDPSSTTSWTPTMMLGVYALSARCQSCRMKVVSWAQTSLHHAQHHAANCIGPQTEQQCR